MFDKMRKEFENLSDEEKLKAFNKMMDNGMPMMKNMCMQMMGTNMCSQEQQDSRKAKTDNCCSDNKESIFATPEIKNLFEDWVSQVQEEIDRYLKENKGASKRDIAQFLKISEESLDYFIKDIKSDSSTCGSSCCDGSKEEVNTSGYETVKIEKIKNVCPMCEDYASQQAEKPIVIMSCEGACLRGEVSRRSANIICHSLAENKTVRLCLGGAFTKDGGQRNLVRNAKRVIALEGCFIKCASRMMKGVVSEVEPEIIITDKLFDFDTNIFGINEMSEEDIQANSIEVAKKILDKL